MRIGEILKAKSSPDVVTVSPGTGVRDLLATLSEHNIGAVIVCSDEGRLAGIVSERDVVRRLHSDGTVINNVVSAIMTEVVETCTAEDELDDVLGTMTERRIRHIPVLDDEAVVGIVSIGDLVKHKIGQLEFERDQLDGYIHQT